MSSRSKMAWESWKIPMLWLSFWSTQCGLQQFSCFKIIRCSCLAPHIKKPPYLGRTEHQMAPWTNLQQHHIWKPNDTRTGCVRFCPVLNFLFVGLKPGLRQSGIPSDGTARILFPDNLHWNHGHPGVLPLNKKGNHSVKDTAMQKYGDWWRGGWKIGCKHVMQPY